ncbi:lipopolysaccharide core heptose(II) kinase RfaY [Escherichia coli]
MTYPVKACTAERKARDRLAMERHLDCQRNEKIMATIQ